MDCNLVNTDQCSSPKSLTLRGDGERSSYESTCLSWAQKNGVGDRPKPQIAAATDAIVKINKTTMCGTDLHILKGDLPSASLAGFWDMKAGRRRRGGSGSHGI